MEFRDSVGIQSLKEIMRFAGGAHEDRAVRDYNDFIRVVVVALKRALDEMLQDVTERHKVPAENRMFIHYTKVSALVSMLRNSEGESNDFLRLYDSTHVNDPEEGRYLWRFSENTLRDQWAGDNRQKTRLHRFLCPCNGPGRQNFPGLSRFLEDLRRQWSRMLIRNILSSEHVIQSLVRGR